MIPLPKNGLVRIISVLAKIECLLLKVFIVTFQRLQYRHESCNIIDLHTHTHT